MSNKPLIGISACVTGEKVRFDTGHKRSDFVMDKLSEHVDYEPICPELAIGMSLPRKPIRQVMVGEEIRVCQADFSGDVTNKLEAFSQKKSGQLDHLSGFIFCQKSPSCGMERVKVYYEHGLGAKHDGRGVFARAVMENNPLIPCEENGRLNDAKLRENFILRVFTYKAWQEMMASGLTKHKLIQFHSKHKYLVMSHKLVSYKALGRLLGQSDLPLEDLAYQYISGLMEALSNLATRKSHANTLFHLQGYFKRLLDKTQKQELVEQIEAYRIGLTPLLVPLTLINHYLRQFDDQQYLASQVYLAPYPDDLRLRYGY
ncbi:MAG: YbgA family protein [Psychrobium sp.]